MWSIAFDGGLQPLFTPVRHRSDHGLESRVGSDSGQQRIPPEPLSTAIAQAYCLVQPQKSHVGLPCHRIEGCSSNRRKRIEFSMTLNVLVHFLEGLIFLPFQGEENGPFGSQ